MRLDPVEYDDELFLARLLSQLDPAMDAAFGDAEKDVSSSRLQEQGQRRAALHLRSPSDDRAASRLRETVREHFGGMVRTELSARIRAKLAALYSKNEHARRTGAGGLGARAGGNLDYANNLCTRERIMAKREQLQALRRELDRASRNSSGEAQAPGAGR